MALMTLKDIQVGQLPDLDKGVIDEFVKGDFLFSNIPFDTIANPVAGGAGWVVSYVKLKDEARTEFRDINGKYESTFVKKEQYSANVKIYGGKFEIDRALRDQGGVENEVALEMQQLIKAMKKGLSYNLINGSVASDAKQFDGLDALVKKSSTDVDAKNIDISTPEKITKNNLNFISIMNDFLSTLDEKPDVLLMNKTLLNRIKILGVSYGQYQAMDTKLGFTVDHYDGIPMVALDTYNGKETIEIVETEGKDKGCTCLYAVKFGGNGLMLATPSSGKTIEVIPPDFSLPDEQVHGLVEMRAVPILRSSKACGVLRNIKVM